MPIGDMAQSGNNRHANSTEASKIIDEYYFREPGENNASTPPEISPKRRPSGPRLLPDESTLSKPFTLHDAGSSSSANLLLPARPAKHIERRRSSATILLQAAGLDGPTTTVLDQDKAGQVIPQRSSLDSARPAESTQRSQQRAGGVSSSNTPSTDGRKSQEGRVTNPSQRMSSLGGLSVVKNAPIGSVRPGQSYTASRTPIAEITPSPSTSYLPSPSIVKHPVAGSGSTSPHAMDASGGNDQTYASRHAAASLSPHPRPETSREASMRSSSSASPSSGGGTPSPSLPANPHLASFTAGIPYDPIMGPLQLESTTGSKATKIKSLSRPASRTGLSLITRQDSYSPSENSRGRSNRGKRVASGGGISSADIFGDLSDASVSSRNSASSSRASSLFRLKKRDSSRQASPVLSPTQKFRSDAAGAADSADRDATMTAAHFAAAGEAPSSPRLSTPSYFSIADGSQSSVDNIVKPKSSMSRMRSLLSGRNEGQREDEERNLRALAELRMNALAYAAETGPLPMTDPISPTGSPSRDRLSTKSSTVASAVSNDVQPEEILHIQIPSSSAPPRPPSPPRSPTSELSNYDDSDEGDRNPNRKTLPLVIARTSNFPSSYVPMDDMESDADDDLDFDRSNNAKDARRRSTLRPSEDAKERVRTSAHPMMRDMSSEAHASEDSSAVISDYATAQSHKASYFPPARSASLRIRTGPAITRPAPASANELWHAKDSIENLAETGSPTDGAQSPERLRSVSQWDRRRNTMRPGQIPLTQPMLRSTSDASSYGSQPPSPGKPQRILSPSLFRTASDMARRLSRNHRVGSGDAENQADDESLVSETSSLRRFLPTGLHGDGVAPKNTSRPESPKEPIMNALQMLRKRSKPSTPTGLPLDPAARHQRSGSVPHLSRPGSIGHVLPQMPTSASTDILEELNAAIGEAIEKTSPPAVPFKDNNVDETEQAQLGPAQSGLEVSEHRNLVSPIPIAAPTDVTRPRSLPATTSQDSEPKRTQLTPSLLHIPNKPDEQGSSFIAYPTPSRRQSHTRQSWEQNRNENYSSRLQRLTKDKPLPPAYYFADDIRKCRGPGERAKVYAMKINELANCSSDLQVWLWSVTTAPQASLQDSSTTSRVSGVDSNAIVQSSPSLQSVRHGREETAASSVTFPLRFGGADVHRARDITQRGPAIFPSTMVPANIPYPGVYSNPHTLSTSAASSVTSTIRSQVSVPAASAGSLAQSGKRGFLGLGRKTSKRVGAGNLSISSPLQSPPTASQSVFASTYRPELLRPSGPRPSLSGSTIPEDAQIDLRNGATPNGYAHSDQTAMPQHSPGAADQAERSGFAQQHEFDAKLTSMADVLPNATRDVLATYLTKSRGDQLEAITRYLEDERAGSV